MGVSFVYLSRESLSPQSAIAFQPPPQVFFVAWSLLFVLGFVHALQSSHDHPAPTILYGTAFMVAGLWVFVSNAEYYRIAALVLCIAAALATTASALQQRPREALDFAVDDVPVNLLAGWLCVATALGLANADTRLNDSRTLVVVCVVASIFSIAFAKPTLPIPLLVAALFMRERIPWGIASFLACVTSICIASVRLA